MAHSSSRRAAISRACKLAPRSVEPATHFPRAVQLVDSALLKPTVQIAAVRRELERVAPTLKPGSADSVAVNFVLARTSAAMRQHFKRNPKNAKGAPVVPDAPL
jgi:hypothetical protein